jgi:hypothetical protein
VVIPNTAPPYYAQSILHFLIHTGSFLLNYVITVYGYLPVSTDNMVFPFSVLKAICIKSNGHDPDTQETNQPTLQSGP